MVELKSTKKVQVDKGKTVIFATVSVAAIVVVGALMVSKGLWGQASYLGRVADKKEAAVKQLEDNKAAVTALTDSYNSFVNQAPNLLGGSTVGDGERDGTNATLVLDALPSKYDFPAVASSLEKLLFGYTINAVNGTDQNAAAAAAAVAAPADETVVAAPVGGVSEIPFAFEVETDYKGFRQLINTFNSSIRPFHITKIELNGTNDKLSVVIDGKTFYQAETGMKVTEEDVQ